jgi:hypothetical protein
MHLGPRPGNLRQSLAPHAAVVALAAPPVLLLASVTQPAHLLPVLGIAAMAAGGVVALLGWGRGERWDKDHISLWDISGALVFLGCAASMLSEPENVLQMFGIAPGP